MENRTNRTLANQKRVMIGIGGLILVILCVYGYTVFDDVETTQQVVRDSSFDLSADSTDPKELWMAKINGENQIIEQRLKYMEDLILEEKKSRERKNLENIALSKEIEVLRESLREFKSKKNDISVSNEIFSFNENPRVYETEYQKKELKEVVSIPSNEMVKHVNNSIPAGTSVKAVLVSSVDVPCGVYSQSDPQPVKLQLLDDARLPNNVRVKLKGGVIIASAYGDISNERIYIRTERLTQTKPTGDFVETEVTGYVTGEDGKYGVRGCLVDRSGKMITNATISGFFSGVNQVLQANRDSLNIYNNPEQDNISAAGNVLRSGGMSGANNAFDRLTDYYIKRADRISPVIQMNAGRIVDVTFTHGCDIGDLHTKEKVSEVRTRNRQIDKGRGLTCVR